MAMAGMGKVEGNTAQRGRACRFLRSVLVPLARRFVEVELRLGPDVLHNIVALKILRHIGATLSMEAFQIDRAVALLVDLDDDRFLFHRIPPHRTAKRSWIFFP